MVEWHSTREEGGCNSVVGTGCVLCHYKRHKPIILRNQKGREEMAQRASSILKKLQNCLARTTKINSNRGHSQIQKICKMMDIWIALTLRIG